MSRVRSLKNIMLFNAGAAYVGDIMAITPPKLARKLEEHRAGGMDRAVKVDMGGEPLECEFTTAAPMLDVLRQYGLTELAGVMLRFVGAYQNDTTGQVDTCEIIVRGRHEEIDRGEMKPGEKGEFKVKSALVYYEESWNGQEVILIDVLNGIERVGGVDRHGPTRAALGL